MNAPAALCEASVSDRPPWRTGDASAQLNAGPRRPSATDDAQACRERLFARLAPLRLGPPDISVAFTISESLPHASDAPMHAVKVHTQGNMHYYVAGASFYIVAAPGLVLQTDCTRQSIDVRVTVDALHSSSGLLDDLLVCAAAPLLRRRGFFPLHAGSASWHGRGVLLAGHSGSGKTTATLALVRHGWRFLSDDTAFLAAGETPTRIFGQPEAVNITPTTASFFPEVQRFFPLGPERIKCNLHVHELYGNVMAQSAPAHLLLFPSVSIERDSRLERLPAGAALANLLPHSIDTWDKGTMKAHFALLSALAETVPAYRLHLGRDLDRLSVLIAQTLP